MTQGKVLNIKISELLHNAQSLKNIFAATVSNIQQGIDILDKADNQAIQNIWAYEVKEFALLQRDICFKLYKYYFLHPDKITGYQNILGDLIKKAEDHLLDSYYNYSQQTDFSPVQLEEWSHYHNPVREVTNQLNTLIKHIEDIQDALDYLIVCNDYLLLEKNELQEVIQRYASDLEAITNNYKVFNDKLTQNEKLFETDSIRSTQSLLERLLGNIQGLNIKKSIPDFSSEGGEKKLIPVDIAIGKLIEKEIDIKRELRAWIGNHIFSLLLDADRLLEKYHEKIGSTILNTKNRIDLLVTDDSTELQNTTQIISDTWNNLTAEVEVYIPAFGKIKASLQERIDCLKIEHVFSEKFLFLPDKFSGSNKVPVVREDRWTDFLPIRKANTLYTQAKNYLLRQSIDKDSDLSAIINFVKEKTLEDADNITMSLFLNKGYMGNSFLVKRERLSEIIKNDLDNWKLGYRGSILLVGKRLSGRSTIIESLPYTLPEMEVIHLLPNKEISFKSRKFQIAYDLGTALEFITKYAISDNVVVGIDDLELWRDTDHFFYKNIVSLLEDLNKFSKRLFFVVSTNHLMRYQLDHQLDFSAYFTSVINCDEMSLNGIVKAIKIRHGASLRDHQIEGNIEDKSKELNIEKTARQIAEDSNFIIGASLKEWAHVHHANLLNGKYRHHKTPSKLIQVIRDRWTIFKHILKFKSTSELEIMQMLGASFLKEVSGDIQFLVSCKILLRDRSGRLSVNEFIIDEIESELMNRQGNLNF